MQKALSFDDILLVPRYSNVNSRKDISLESRVTNNISVKFPIISANMPSVTGPKLAIKMWQLGAFSILHRFNSPWEAMNDFNFVRSYGAYAGVSLGLGDDRAERFNLLYDAGARIFCIDVAHGHHERVIDMIDDLKSKYEDEIEIIAGNVATGIACRDLAEAGADAIKVGIGPGAACTTREVAGFGVPQLSAIEECAYIKNMRPDLKIIADGGIKNSGDIVKALVFGADTVMLGSLFAGCDESPNPGEYYGNASKRIKDYNAPEGVEGTVDLVGPVENVLKNLAWGIKSGLSYAGVESIEELHESEIEYTIVSPQTMTETRTRI